LGNTGEIHFDYFDDTLPAFRWECRGDFGMGNCDFAVRMVFDDKQYRGASYLYAKPVAGADKGYKQHGMFVPPLPFRFRP